MISDDQKVSSDSETSTRLPSIMWLDWWRHQLPLIYVLCTCQPWSRDIKRKGKKKNKKNQTRCHKFSFVQLLIFCFAEKILPSCHYSYQTSTKIDLLLLRSSSHCVRAHSWSRSRLSSRPCRSRRCRPCLAYGRLA